MTFQLPLESTASLAADYLLPLESNPYSSLEWLVLAIFSHVFDIVNYSSLDYLLTVLSFVQV